MRRQNTLLKYCINVRIFIYIGNTLGVTNGPCGTPPPALKSIHGRGRAALMKNSVLVFKPTEPSVIRVFRVGKNRKQCLGSIEAGMFHAQRSIGLSRADLDGIAFHIENQAR